MNSENALLIARLEDIIKSSAKKQFPSFIGFLNEQEISVLLQYLKNSHINNYRFFGGYENSDRCLLGVSNGDYIEDYYYPIAGISFKYKPDFKLIHRDFLGSLMGLGLKRETIGDILTGDGYTVVFVKNDIKDYILSQIQKVGNVGVQVEDWDNYTLPLKKDFESINCTVSSARLDNIVSSLVPLSRDKSATLIKQGMVFVNSLVTDNVSHIVKTGDKISIRGKGKFFIQEFSGVTKKGRLKLIVQKYI